MIEQIAKILIGTAFYVGIVWVAQRNPRAAGMMLTFPTLNGLVLLIADPAAIEEAAGAMLLMPLINAVIWAFYLTSFGPFVDRRIPPAAASGLLIGAGAIGWLLVAALITEHRSGVPSGLQWAYVMGVLAAGGVITLAVRKRVRAPLTAAASSQPLPILLGRYRIRIAIFALTLAAIAAIDRLGASPALLGAVAGAPLVAMFGMQTLAGDAATPLTTRRAAFDTMRGGLWLGPGIAVVFVAVYWRALHALSSIASGVAYAAAGAGLLLAGWSLCLLAVWYLAHRLPGVASARTS